MANRENRKVITKLFVSHSPCKKYTDCVKNIKISLYMSERMYTFAE